MLAAARLDVAYERARGDLLFRRGAGGEELAVLDLLGGFGASLFGHNAPELVAIARRALDDELPFNAQGSVRGNAALLAERLSEMLERRTGRRFVTTFASTGAECVEAAAKHALLANGRRVEARRKRLERELVRVRVLAARGALEIGPAAQERLDRLAPGRADLGARLEAIHRANLAALEPSTTFLSAARGFHGKTLGALPLTHSSRYRDPFAGSGLRAVFVDPEDPAAIGAAIARGTRPLHPLTAEGAALRIGDDAVVDACALFVEPLQGEGGVHVVPKAFLDAAREAATAHGLPLVFDEIQCGMGRTGTFLFSEQQGVVADAYLLSKSLGGGLAKISAFLVREDLYEEEFGVLHTSTFAEDDPSAAVALAALDLLERDGALYENARARGDQLLAGLSALQREYPDVIGAVRGRGLMIGVELAPQDGSHSALVRFLAGSGVLGFIVSGHLLHEHGIRVAPALSSTQTIRLEPSARIAPRDCDRALEAFRQLCEVLHRGDAHRLAGFLAAGEGGAAAHAAGEPEPRPVERPVCAPGAPAVTGVRPDRRVAFVGHFIEAEHVRDWDPTLAPLSSGDLERLLDRVWEEAEPQVVERHVVRSPRGVAVELDFIGYFVDSRILAARMGARALARIRAQLAEAARAAAGEGCSILGLGGFTSIVTNNGLALEADGIAVTTGNALTAGMGIQALVREAAAAGLDPDGEAVAIVGAAGNIASVYGEILAERVSRLMLVGRPGGEVALRELAARVYADALGALLVDRGRAPPGRRGDVRVAGVASAIRDTRAVSAALRGDAPRTDVGAWLATELERELADPPVQLDTTPEAVKGSRLIVAASNSPDPVLFPHMIADGPVVICDIALPHDTHESVLDRRDVRWIRGGVARLPLDPGFRVGGIPLAPGEAFACMSETLLCGLEGIPGSFSLGRITKEQVGRITAVAAAHGFELSRAKTERSF